MVQREHDAHSDHAMVEWPFQIVPVPKITSAGQFGAGEGALDRSWVIWVLVPVLPVLPMLVGPLHALDLCALPFKLD